MINNLNNKKVFITLLAVLVVVAVGYIIFRAGIFSKEILKLEILGVENAKIGDEIEYTVVYKNNGNFVLQNPRLTFVLPENSLTEDSKIILIKNLEDIYPGEQNSLKFKARLFGKEGDYKTAKASLSYIPKNITATYESHTTFLTKIDTSPITLTFDLPTKAEKGKTLQYAVNYFSNIDYPLENLSVRIDPIPGFDFVSADPISLDGLEWKLKTLNKAQGGRINISGIVSGDTNNDLSFVAKLGMWQNGMFVVVKEASSNVQIIQPLLLITQQVNGSGSYVASPGDTLNYKVVFTNIGSTPFDNLYMVARLDGSAFDLSTLQAGNGGQVQSNDNMIIWDYNQVSALKYLDVQQNGEVNFSVKLKKDWVPPQNEAESVITDSINISQITQKFTVKVSSGLVVSQKAYFLDPNIQNSGPIPPEVGKATKYTINWEIKNYSGDIKNVKVKAVLPQNVSLTGKILPQSEAANFAFDSQSREIVWSAGDIASGTGVTGDPVSLSFQVSLVPNASQRGDKASLIGLAQISGENQFTNTAVVSRDSGVDTSLPDDVVNSGGGIVR